LYGELLNEDHLGVIAQFNAIHVVGTTPQDIHPDFQLVLSKHQHVFEPPKYLPSSCGEHHHGIPLILGTQPPNVHPYGHPFAHKFEIESIIQELLEVGVICHSTILYSSLVVMVLKKESTWCMCPNFKVLNKLIIKDTFPIPVIYGLLDELHGVNIFTKLDLFLATTRSR
jgi:hypothetical protein